MSSPLYDLAGRSTLGFAVAYDLVPELIKRAQAAASAELIGERMAEVLARPYFLQLFILFEGYLMGREQALIESAGFNRAAIARDAQDTMLVIDWFARVCSTYRTDGCICPGAEVFDQPILDADQLAPYLGGEPLDPATAARVQRAIGTLELYALTVHGEQRDGNFDHGPYRDHDGRRLVFHEINDLNNDFLPWVDADQRLGVEAVGVVRVFAPEVEIVCDMFGTSSVAPSGAPSELRAVLIREGHTVRALSLNELEEIAAHATRATVQLFERIAGWTPEYRTAYGRPLWLNHFAPILRVAGAEDQLDWLRSAGEHAGPADIAAVAGGGSGEIWARLAAGEEMFTPVGDVAVVR
jgi:hypothetical protein